MEFQVEAIWFAGKKGEKGSMELKHHIFGGKTSKNKQTKNKKIPSLSRAEYGSHLVPSG